MKVCCNAHQCFAFTPQAFFPTMIWIFTEGDWIKARLSSWIFSILLHWPQKSKWVWWCQLGICRRPWTTSSNSFIVNTLLSFTLFYTMYSSVPTLNYKKSVVWNIEPLDLVVSFFDFWLSTFDFLIAWQHLLMFSDRSFELLESSLLLIVQLQ